MHCQIVPGWAENINLTDVVEDYGHPFFENCTVYVNASDDTLYLRNGKYGWLRLTPHLLQENTFEGEDLGPLVLYSSLGRPRLVWFSGLGDVWNQRLEIEGLADPGMLIWRVGGANASAHALIPHVWVILLLATLLTFFFSTGH